MLKHSALLVVRLNRLRVSKLWTRARQRVEDIGSFAENIYSYLVTTGTVAGRSQVARQLLAQVHGLCVQVEGNAHILKGP